MGIRYAKVTTNTGESFLAEMDNGMFDMVVTAITKGLKVTLLNEYAMHSHPVTNIEGVDMLKQDTDRDVIVQMILEGRDND